MSARDPAGVVPLAEVTSAGHGGRKAFGLAGLARDGIPVPPTFVLPPDAAAVPADALLEALGGAVAVRSSATGEDLPDASFAGQFRSFLGVRTADALVRAVQDCRAALRSPAVAAYCAARGLDVRTIRMAVMVQRMVEADVAGVLFTVHPTSGRDDELLIEACPGLADELLAGRVSGAQIAVRGDTVPEATAPLTPGQVRSLVDVGRRIQALAGAPQDVEWAMEGGRLFVLQARPITRLGFAGIDGEWSNADFRDGGVASTVVTPLMWSLYARAWDEALKGYLRDLHLLERDFDAARVFYGRPYWNLGAVKRCAARLPGFVEREFDEDAGVRPRYAGDGQRTPARPRDLVRALPALRAARGVLRRQAARDREVLRSRVWTRYAVEPARLSDAELVRQFRSLVEEAYRAVEVSYFRTIFCVSVAKLAFRAASRGLPVSYARLVGGLDELAHVRCSQALWELANGGAPGLEAFLDRHGHHGRRELDLRVPRWREEPAFVAALAGKLAGVESPAAAGRRQRRQFREELERAQAMLRPWRRRRFARRLARLRTFLWLREEMRDVSVRLYAVIRRLALEIGRRAAGRGHLRAADDVFHLTSGEVSTVLERRLDDVAAARRAAARMYRDFRPPNEIGRGFAAPAAAPRAGRRLGGIGASPGVLSGRACVVTSLDEAAKLGPGDVLVCPFTDPGWTPMLSVAGAVVTETGGLLSHAAVLCREAGVPAVLNVPDATRVLRDGQRVRVDGDRGHVDLVG